LGSFGVGTDINMTWNTLDAKFPESAKVLKNFDLQAPPSTEKARDIAEGLVGCILQTQVNARTESAFLGRISTDENTKFLVIALLPKFENCPFDVVFSELEQLLKVVDTGDRPWETKATTGVTTRSDDNGTASINQTAAMGTLIAEQVQTVITTSVQENGILSSLVGSPRVLMAMADSVQSDSAEVSFLASILSSSQNNAAQNLAPPKQRRTQSCSWAADSGARSILETFCKVNMDPVFERTHAVGWTAGKVLPVFKACRPTSLPSERGGRKC
jgi:hypothetical protein